MQDARFITDYFPNGMFEQQLQTKTKTQSNADYRRYLTNHSNKIMNANKQIALSQNVEMKFNVVSDKQQGPYLFRSLQDNNVPQGYQTNDTKQSYLSRAQLNALKFNQYKYLNI